ncbi:MAG TPA: SAM-dependent methyltransferase [Pseudonocardiaceae bacterium]|jgi:SAM-dependent methyltransferase|nr:SAM-dependent methyltransferase [Pseudonocardiaceae bacterium]
MPADHLSWVPADVDLSRANAARVYDYVLGGANNFEVDREFAKELLTRLPDAQSLAQENRGFLRRTVTHLAEQGVGQFIDLGSGIPTVGNTHEVVQCVNPGAKVVYVDNEPVAVAHSELILQDNENAAILRGDVRDVGAVLSHEVTKRLIDFDEPVAVLAFAVLHFVSDEQDPYRLVARYRDVTVPGSYLVVSHVTRDGRPETDYLVEQYRRSANPVTERTRAEVERFFAGYDLVEPGVVFTREWRPEIELEYAANSLIYGGVGRRI